jgi:hypothetical protein
MENKELENKYYQSFRNIDFVTKYKKIMDEHNHPLNEILSKMDKPTIAKTFKELGYNFKISSPGQFYVFYETLREYSFKVSFQISGGIITSYIYLYYNNNIVKIDYTNFAFIFRFLKNNMDEITNAPKFKNYDELRIILKNILKIYEEFKSEFLKNDSD